MDENGKNVVEGIREKSLIGLVALAVLLMGLTLFWQFSGAAEDVYPTKSITWLLPYKPGGGFDVIARAISPFMEKHLRKVSLQSRGVSIVIKNEPGGAGEKAISSLFKAPPDGYTIGAFAGGFLAEKFLAEKDYDITRLTYLVRLDEMPRLLVTRKTGPKNWNEIVAMSKAKPIKWGVGTFGREIHITSIIANEIIGIPAKFIAFGGTAESLNAVLRGDVHLIMVSEDSAKALIDSGEVRVLLSFDRKSKYPDSPSIQDLGYPQLVNPTKGNRFLAAPPGLPKRVGKVIVESFQQACRDDEFLAWSKKTGFELNPIYGEELEKLLKELIDFYREKAPLIKKYLS